MIDANPYIVEIRCAELARDAARGTELKDCRPDRAGRAGMTRGAGIAVVIGSVALGALALGGTLV